MKIAAAVILLSVGSVTAYSQPTKFKTLDGKPPIVIGHRGAAGYLPEHTLEGYRLAIKQGVDIIEPDLVMTKDGVFIARHEPMLGGTTDIATKFPASRRTTRLVDGVSVTDYFASDFTVAEIKTLRAIQSNSARSQEFNGLYAIPTLSEIIKVVENERTSTGRAVGLYPEVKHSTFHAAIFGAHVFEDKLLMQLHAAFGNKASAPVFIQSFEVSNLQYLRQHTNIRLVQLIDGSAVANDGSVTSTAPSRQPFDFVANHDARTYADLLTPDGLRFVKTYANGVCPWKPYLVRTVASGDSPNGDAEHERQPTCCWQHWCH